MITRLPGAELQAVLIKAQFNVASDGRRYTLGVPRIAHEYMLLWRMPERTTVVSAAAGHRAGGSGH